MCVATCILNYPRAGRAIAVEDRIEAVAKRAIKWANLPKKNSTGEKVAINVSSFPPDKRNVGTAAI